MIKQSLSLVMALTMESHVGRRRKVLSDHETNLKQSLKILIGSVGSKSNKVDYVKGLLTFLQQHSNLSKSVLWTPATTRVASLFSAADVYVINSQVIHGHNIQVVRENTYAYIKDISALLLINLMQQCLECASIYNVS